MIEVPQIVRDGWAWRYEQRALGFAQEREEAVAALAEQAQAAAAFALDGEALRGAAVKLSGAKGYDALLAKEVSVELHRRAAIERLEAQMIELQLSSEGLDDQLWSWALEAAEELRSSMLSTIREHEAALLAASDPAETEALGMRLELLRERQKDVLTQVSRLRREDENGRTKPPPMLTGEARSAWARMDSALHKVREVIDDARRALAPTADELRPLIAQLTIDEQASLIGGRALLIAMAANHREMASAMNYVVQHGMVPPVRDEPRRVIA